MADRSESSGLFRRRLESRLDWLAVVLGVFLAGIHVYLGLTQDETPFVVVGVGFLVGVVVFLTGYWQPVLYLLGAIYALTLGVIWVLDGTEYETIGIVTGTLSTIFLALAVYLFFRGGRFAPSG